MLSVCWVSPHAFVCVDCVSVVLLNEYFDISEYLLLARLSVNRVDTAGALQQL